MLIDKCLSTRITEIVTTCTRHMCASLNLLNNLTALGTLSILLLKLDIYGYFCLTFALVREMKTLWAVLG